MIGLGEVLIWVGWLSITLPFMWMLALLLLAWGMGDL